MKNSWRIAGRAALPQKVIKIPTPENWGAWTACAVHSFRAAAFFSTGWLGHTNCVSVFAPNGRGGFRWTSAGSAPTRRGHKRVDTCGFHPLVNHPFPLDSLAQIADMWPLRNRGTAEGFFFRIFLNLFAVSDTVLLHIRFTLRRARHNSAAQVVSALW